MWERNRKKKRSFGPTWSYKLKNVPRTWGAQLQRIRHRSGPLISPSLSSRLKLFLDRHRGDPLWRGLQVHTWTLTWLQQTAGYQHKINQQLRVSGRIKAPNVDTFKQTKGTTGERNCSLLIIPLDENTKAFSASSSAESNPNNVLSSSPSSFIIRGNSFIINRGASSGS